MKNWLYKHYPNRRQRLRFREILKLTAIDFGWLVTAIFSYTLLTDELKFSSELLPLKIAIPVLIAAGAFFHLFLIELLIYAGVRWINKRS